MVTKNTEARDAAQVAKGFLRDLGRRDFDGVTSHLAPNVWFRALLPRGLEEAKSSNDAVEALRSWYAGAEAFEVLEQGHHSLEGREYIRYRFHLRPDWAPADWHIIEQVGFCRVKDGRISRLDLVCTGFFPTNGRGKEGQASISSGRGEMLP